jgi:carbon monoxide dehydrogenase subunit G
MERRLDQCGHLGRRQLDIPEQYHGWGVGTGFGEETVQVAVECDANTTFQSCTFQNLLVGGRAQSGIAHMNDVKAKLAEQGSQLGGKVFVKKQPKH